MADVTKKDALTALQERVTHLKEMRDEARTLRATLKSKETDGTVGPAIEHLLAEYQVFVQQSQVIVPESVEALYHRGAFKSFQKATGSISRTYALYHPPVGDFLRRAHDDVGTLSCLRNISSAISVLDKLLAIEEELASAIVHEAA
jgi:hypothetical protein